MKQLYYDITTGSIVYRSGSTSVSIDPDSAEATALADFMEEVTTRIDPIISLDPFTDPVKDSLVSSSLDTVSAIGPWGDLSLSVLG